MLLYLSYPNSGRCALKSPAIIVLVFASFMSGRSEFVPGGQYILWMVNFVLDFVLKERSKVEEEQQRPSSASYWSRQDGRYHRQTPKPTKTVLVGG